MAFRRPRPTVKKLRTPPCYAQQFTADAIQEDRGFMAGVVAMERGEIRGHDMEADEQTLSEVVRLANTAVEASKVANLRVRGLKMRSGHPNMSSDAFGTTMAAGRDFRLDGDRVRMDAQFLEAADEKMRRHAFTLARERPDFFGLSLVVSGDVEKRLEEDGTAAKGEDGKELLPLFRPTAVHAVDFVDRGAATSSLFADSTVLLSAEATEKLDEILTLPGAGERLRRFVDRFEVDHPGASDIFRAALCPQPDEETMSKATPEAEPSQKAPAVTNEGALRQLKAAGYSVQPPKAEPEGSPPPVTAADTELAAEIRALRAAVEKERKLREASEAKAAEKERALALAPFAARLDKLTHLEADDRAAALETISAYLDAGKPEYAERFATAHERIPDPMGFADLDRQVSIPIGEGEQAQVDVGRYQSLAKGPDGEPIALLQGDRKAMARAAWITENVKDPEERRAARAKSWAERRGMQP